MTRDRGKNISFSKEKERQVAKENLLASSGLVQVSSRIEDDTWDDICQDPTGLKILAS